MGNRQLLSILTGLTEKEAFEGGKSDSLRLEYIHCSNFPGLDRSHMVSMVAIDKQDYLVDVGFGK